MSVTTLLEDFRSWPKCVVEVTDISQAILRRGFVHSIEFVPFDEDPRDILGILVRWEHRWPYGEVTEHCAVCYNSNVPEWFQCIICCKEMVHILENGSAQTNTEAGVNALLDVLFPGGVERDVIDLFRTQTLHEYFALYQATNLMFPDHHRKPFALKLKAKEISIEEVAAEFDLPVDVVETILSAEWKATEAGTLLHF